MFSRHSATSLTALDVVDMVRTLIKRGTGQSAYAIHLFVPVKASAEYGVFGDNDAQDYLSHGRHSSAHFVGHCRDIFSSSAEFEARDTGVEGHHRRYRGAKASGA